MIIKLIVGCLSPIYCFREWSEGETTGHKRLWCLSYPSRVTSHSLCPIDQTHQHYYTIINNKSCGHWDPCWKKVIIEAKAIKARWYLSTVFPLSELDFLVCVCVYTCHVCMHVHLGAKVRSTHVCTCMWKSKSNVGCLPLWPFTLSFESRSH